MLKSENAAQSQNGFPSARESVVLINDNETTSTVIPCAAQHDNDALLTRDPDERDKQQDPRGRSARGMTKPPPTLSWTLYSSPPPGGDDLRTDLVAMHMAYETLLSALQAGRSSAEARPMEP